MMRKLLISALRRLSKTTPQPDFDLVKVARNLGVKIGSNCRLVGHVRFGSEPYLVSIGNHVSITESEFITHDGGVWVFRERHPKIDQIAPIKVMNNVFIGAQCIILPGVTIHDNVVVGARSVVTKTLPGGFVYVGAPARPIKTIDEYWQKLKNSVMETKLLGAEEKKAYLMKRFGT
jgi:acetyltransferase-like isoleucine patch superfamily enzyme